VVFLDGRGREVPDLRLVDFTPPEQFLSRLASVKMATAKEKEERGEDKMLAE
jgi:hypothetical protein